MHGTIPVIMKFRIFACLIALCLWNLTARAVIIIANIADKTKYDAPRSFTVTADPNAATTTASLDGLSVAVGPPVSVTAFGYHELVAQSRAADSTLLDSIRVRFITHDP